MKILFVHSDMPTFAKIDFDILSKIHEVRILNFSGHRQGLFRLLKTLPVLWRDVRWSDMTYSWFGKLPAFFAVLFSRILNKRSVVVVSGGEVCSFTFANGRYRSICTHPIKKWFPKYIAKNANMILPVSKYVMREAITNIGVSAEKIKMIYHGFDANKFYRKADGSKKPSVITIAEIMEENLYHKRLVEFIESARLLPKLQFVVIGPDFDGTLDKIKKMAPKNVKFTGGLYEHDLVEYLSSAAVYVQASVWESFGCAVAEAMLCECIPVVSRIPALEEVVGDCGIYLANPVTAQEIAEKVQLALKKKEMGTLARLRVINNFSLDARRKNILESIKLQGC